MASGAAVESDGAMTLSDGKWWQWQWIGSDGAGKLSDGDAAIGFDRTIDKWSR